MPADRQIEAARKLIKLFADALDVDGQVQLWDGKAYALGEARDAPFIIKISSPGVIGNLIRRPKLDTLIQHYARSEIDFDGISLIDFGHRFNDSHTRRKMRSRGKRRVKSSRSGTTRSLCNFTTTCPTTSISCFWIPTCNIPVPTSKTGAMIWRRPRPTSSRLSVANCA